MPRFRISSALLLLAVFLGGCAGEGGDAGAPEGRDPPASAAEPGEAASPESGGAASGAPGSSAELPGPQAEPGPASPSPTTAEVPEGGLQQWVEDIRRRLEDVEMDPRASYEEVLELYLTRHAFIERYYGEGGVLTGSEHPELARAIAAQDTAFQELLELTGTTDYIERTHLLHAIRNVRLEMERILDAGREAGVPLER